MSAPAQSCRLATNPRTGEPFGIVASDVEAEFKERAGWPVVKYAPVTSPAGGGDESGVVRLRERLAAVDETLRLIAMHARLDQTERGVTEARRYALLAEDAREQLRTAVTG